MCSFMAQGPLVDQPTTFVPVVAPSLYPYRVQAAVLLVLSVVCLILGVILATICGGYVAGVCISLPYLGWAILAFLFFEIFLIVGIALAFHVRPIQPVPLPTPLVQAGLSPPPTLVTPSAYSPSAAYAPTKGWPSTIKVPPICPACGAPVAAGGVFCSYCGRPLQSP